MLSPNTLVSASLSALSTRSDDSLYQRENKASADNSLRTNSNNGKSSNDDGVAIACATARRSDGRLLDVHINKGLDREQRAGLQQDLGLSRKTFWKVEEGWVCTQCLAPVILSTKYSREVTPTVAL